MGGDEERARKIVEQSPEVLRSTGLLGRFAELIEIMGGVALYSTTSTSGNCEILDRECQPVLC
jgi:hypothetical protein